MPKEKIFSKLKYKDYNNLLEQVLEKKDFSSTGKNLILSVLYKMETNYNDYKTVKRDITAKEEILTDFINLVKEYCNSLIVIKPESKRSSLLSNTESKYIANLDKKELEVFPNEKYILEGLYSLYNNNAMVNDKYGILKDAIMEIFIHGNSSNNIELLRDFNGFAWYVAKNEFEDTYANLIFQDIRIIAGNDLLKDWVYNKDNDKDYIEELKKELNRRYDKEMADIVFNMYFENYYHLDIIDNGLYDCYNLDYVERAQADADRIHAKLDFVPGSNILLEKLVSGHWDNQFLIVQPNMTITQGTFFDC